MSDHLKKFVKSRALNGVMLAGDEKFFGNQSLVYSLANNTLWTKSNYKAQVIDANTLAIKFDIDGVVKCGLGTGRFDDQTPEGDIVRYRVKGQYQGKIRIHRNSSGARRSKVQGTSETEILTETVRKPANFNDPFPKIAKKQAASLTKAINKKVRISINIALLGYDWP